MLDINKTLILGSDENSIEVTPRVSKRAKRVSIKISGNKGIELIIPQRVSIKRALSFLKSKESWIIEKSHSIRKREKIEFTDGNKVPVQGKFYNIIHSGNMRGVTHIEENNLLYSGMVEYGNKKITAFLKELAKKEIKAKAEVEAIKLGVKFNKITIRDTSSRWGSCSHTNSLSFSWRLIMAPKEVLEYVVAHEVAHLVEMNHSKKFWQVVESIYPEHKMARNWLKQHGESLHYYG